jgi:hypothetical protein
VIVLCVPKSKTALQALSYCKVIEKSPPHGFCRLRDIQYIHNLKLFGL